MKHYSDKQSTELRKFVFKRFILSFIIYCMSLLILYAVFDSFISPAIGNVIAEHTSHWEYISIENADSLWNDHQMIQFDTSFTSNEEGHSYLKYRALDTYALLKTIKDDALPILFMLGIAGLIFYSLNKFVGYFAELSASVASLFKDKNASIALSKELKVVQNELQSIQNESLKNEQAAQEAERRKNELIAYIAHDLRTPLTSILGYSTLLDSKDVDERKRKNYFEIINAQAQKMSTMLDDFFDIARLNMSNFKLNKQNLDLRTLCLQISDDFYPSALEKELSFKIDIPLDLNCYADPKYLTRALSNIVRNAIAFATHRTDIIMYGSTIQIEENNNLSESNNVIVTATDNVSKTLENKLNEQVILKITNSGKEISPEALPYVFDTFYREDPARNKNFGNAGLGLAITKNIITAHKGTIEVSSTNGSTTFTVILPLKH